MTSLSSWKSFQKVFGRCRVMYIYPILTVCIPKVVLHQSARREERLWWGHWRKNMTRMQKQPKFITVNCFATMLKYLWQGTRDWKTTTQASQYFGTYPRGTLPRYTLENLSHWMSTQWEFPVDNTHKCTQNPCCSSRICRWSWATSRWGCPRICHRGNDVGPDIYISPSLRWTICNRNAQDCWWSLEFEVGVNCPLLESTCWQEAPSNHCCDWRQAQ